MTTGAEWKRKHLSIWSLPPSHIDPLYYNSCMFECNIHPDLAMRVKHEALAGLDILPCRKHQSHFPCTVFLHWLSRRNVCSDVVRRRGVWLPQQPNTGYPGSLTARANCISFLIAKIFLLPASTQPGFFLPWNIPVSESSYPQNSWQNSALHILLFIWRKQWRTGLPTGS